MLFEKAVKKEQKVKCQYLYAHCLRHIGKELDLAYHIFTELINDESYVDDKIRLRSIYSAASIKMFQNNSEYDYIEAFDKIEHILHRDAKNEIWKPYVIRHKAIYEYKINNNFAEAEKILKQAIKLLKVTPLRIKYDIYFELGELYRIWGNSPKDYQESFNNYCEALQFSKQVHDYNLYSSSQLGIILLNLKNGFEVDINILRTIISETQKIDLNINYNYALYVKHLVYNEAFSDELTSYWKKIQYPDLLFAASKSGSEKYNLKLTVM